MGKCEHTSTLDIGAGLKLRRVKGQKNKLCLYPMATPMDKATAEIPTHPIQKSVSKEPARVPQVVTMLAYEVYCEVYSPQEEIVTGNCRGGFSTSELVAFLYARSFPRTEWHKRFYEALKGMKNV